jgi:hypothetical protein
MAPYPLDKAISNALAAKTCEPGMCLQVTRGWYGVASKYPDAATAWANAKHRAPGDHSPPRGAIVWWTGGSSGYGHVGMSLGDGTFRSTDLPTKGKIGTVALSAPSSSWGQDYAGWSADINGVTIPELLELLEGDMPISDADLAAIAARTWADKTEDPVTGETVSMRELVKRTRTNSKQAAESSKEAAKNTAS